MPFFSFNPEEGLINTNYFYMFKFFNHNAWGLVAAILFAVSHSSCSSDTDQTRYVAAKLVDSDMWSIVDVTTGEIVHKDEFKSQPSVIVNGKFFVKNQSGLYEYYTVDDVKKPINSEPYLYASSFNKNDIAFAVFKGKGISIINGRCDIIANLDNSIVSAREFSYGFSQITNDDQKSGYINEKGEIVIKPIYDTSSPFSEDGIAIVGKAINDTTYKCSAIDTKGVELFTFSTNEYKDYSSFVNGYISVQKANNEVVLLDKAGKKLCSIGKWKGYIPYWLGFYDNVIVFKDGDSYGLKDKQGNVVLRAKYDELIPLPKINTKYYLAKKQDKYGIVDNEDNVIIPFDYSILGYINKDVLLVGEGKSFSFMDKDLKDIGQNNYTNLSFMSGSYIRSNYFDADKEARKIIDNITDSSFFNTTSGMHLRDFKDKLSGYKYADTEKTTIHDYDYPFVFIYSFDNYLSSQTYEYIYGYRFPKEPEYNYNANLTVVSVNNSSYKVYQPEAEEALAKAFDTQIQKKGFKPVDGKPNWFKNEKTGMAVSLSYEDGTVSVKCVYSDRYMNIDVKRKPREDSSQEDVQVDYVDTFGFESSNDTDSNAIVKEAVAVD